MEYKMKEILLHKLVIRFDDGKFQDGVILYQVKDNGAITEKQRYRSLDIKNMPIDKKELVKMISEINKATKTTEGIND